MKKYHIRPTRQKGEIIGHLVDQSGEYYHRYIEDSYVISAGGAVSLTIKANAKSFWILEKKPKK